MGVLKDYQTWNNFVQFFPSFKRLKENPDGILDATKKDTFFEKRHADVYLKFLFTSRGVPDRDVEELLSRYGKTASECENLRYELGILLGLRGEKNKLVKNMGSFGAKYNDEYATDMQDLGFLKKMQECVGLARTMLNGVLIQLTRRQLAEPQDPSFKLFDEAFAYHFELFPPVSGKQWMAVVDTFRKTKSGLDGMFRLAALDLKQFEAGTSGVVIHRQVSELELEMEGCSKNKILTKDEWDRTIVAGSVHIDYDRFKTPPVKKNGLVFPKAFVAACIVHEATHRWAFTNDDGYYFWQTHIYKKSSPEKKLLNADCYAVVALSIQHNFVLKVRGDLKQLGE